MPRWSLVAIAIAAALVAALPFGVVPSSYELGTRWAVAAGFVSGAVVAGKKNLAIWCGLFAALAVVFQPAFPIDLKQIASYVHVGAAIIAASCVVREW